jgi:superfamily II DNA or RNA helicase
MDHGPTDSRFPVRFAGTLRPSQQEAAEIAARQLAQGRRRIHIVAPPGSGKTVLGLYLWAEHVRLPAVVLSPNSAIQAQWAARISLFEIDAAAPAVISTDPQSPGLLTSLTYQSVTLPRRGGDDLDARAVELWQDRLIEADQASDPQEAAVWIEDLKRHNRAYFDRRRPFPMR